MDVIVSRVRLAGPLSTYLYRALVPLCDVDAKRRGRCVIIQAAVGERRIASTRLSDVMAPDAWFDRHLAIACGGAARLSFVAKRIEALIIRAIYPEMTSHLPPLSFLLNHVVEDASYRVTIRDLNASFDHLAPNIDTLMAGDLGLFQGCDRRAA
ncbi:hypothetical protein ACFOKF_22140 [Sphingobium rhizovicinum]|uniref:Uncharacterized protein n=1 Tax=Sphingobium rhizovicinum TaxID=432308 RepID=A0ABV7NK09_9SPHN